MSVGNKIKKIRELRNLTQEACAEHAGLTQTALSKIEKGNSDVSFKTLEKIAEALKLSVEDIVCFNEKMIFFNIHKNKNATGLTINQVSPSEKKLYEDYILTLKAEITHLKGVVDKLLKSKNK